MDKVKREPAQQVGSVDLNNVFMNTPTLNIQRKPNIIIHPTRNIRDRSESPKLRQIPQKVNDYKQDNISKQDNTNKLENINKQENLKTENSIKFLTSHELRLKTIEDRYDMIDFHHFNKDTKMNSISDSRINSPLSNNLYELLQSSRVTSSKYPKYQQDEEIRYSERQSNQMISGFKRKMKMASNLKLASDPTLNLILENQQKMITDCTPIHSDRIRPGSVMNTTEPMIENPNGAKIIDYNCFENCSNSKNSPRAFHNDTN